MNLNDYLNIKVISPLTLSLGNVNPNDHLYYKVNDGGWTQVSNTGVFYSANTNDVIYFKKVLTSNQSTVRYTNIVLSDGECVIGGNVLSLCYGDDFAYKKGINYNYAFVRLFYQSTSTIRIDKELLSHIEIVKSYCYQQMFCECPNLLNVCYIPYVAAKYQCYLMFSESGLEKVPFDMLPSTTLTVGCYDSMFKGCANLKNAPHLPATSLASSCYYRMFSVCTSLLLSPKMTVLSAGSFSMGGMFSDCSSLISAPDIRRVNLTAYVFSYTFYGCSSLAIRLTNILNHEWSYPSTGGEDDMYWTDSMFSGTAGGPSFYPSPETKYYWNYEYVKTATIKQGVVENGSITLSDVGVIEIPYALRLSATPDQYYKFKEYRDNGIVISNSSDFVYNVNDENLHTITAVFDFDGKTVTANNDGHCSVSGGGVYSTGDTVTLRATNIEDKYVFDGWYVNDVLVSKNTTYQFVVSENITVVAKATYNYVTVNISSDAHCVTTPSSPFEVEKGNDANVSVEVIDDSYVFDGWYIGGQKVSSDLNYSFIPTTDVSIQAKTREKPYVVLNYTAQNCTISGTSQGTKRYGTNVSLIATVFDGFEWDGWYSGDTRISTDMNLEFSITDNTTIRAVALQSGLHFYFEDVMIDDNAIVGLKYIAKTHNDNFYLGSTICKNFVLDVMDNASPVGIDKVYFKDGSTILATLYVDEIKKENLTYNSFYLYDYMLLADREYTANRETVKQILENTIGDHFDFETDYYGMDIVVDQVVNVRTLIGYLAEINGGYAWVENDTIKITKWKESPQVQIEIENCSSFTKGEYHKIGRVYLELAQATHYYPIASDDDTLYLNSDNILITDSSSYTIENQIQHIYDEIKDFDFYNINVANMPVPMVGKIMCYAGMIVNFVIDGETYKTILQCDFIYNGGWLGGLDCSLNTPKQEETTVSPSKNINKVVINVNREVGTIEQTIKDNENNISRIIQDASSLTGIFSSAEGAKYIVASAEGLRVSKTLDGGAVTITEDGVYITNDDGVQVASMKSNEFDTTNWVFMENKKGNALNLFKRRD